MTKRNSKKLVEVILPAMLGLLLLGVMCTQGHAFALPVQFDAFDKCIHLRSPRPVIDFIICFNLVFIPVVILVW